MGKNKSKGLSPEEAIQKAHDEQDNTGAPGKPEGERFTCNQYPNYTFSFGAKTYRFSGGEFVTDDPGVIEAIRGLPFFGAAIFADNQDLNPPMPPAESPAEEAE